MTTNINPKQQELRKVTTFLIVVAIILFASIAAVLYFNGRSSGDVYSDRLDYTNQTNFTYDVTKVDIGKSGATLKNNSDRASIILLNPLRISDKYQGGEQGRILAFEEVADKAPGAEIYYQISGDGQKWQYYGDQKWQDVGTCQNCYNTASEINDKIEEFIVKSDTLNVKALLVSSDSVKPNLQAINLQVKGEDCSAINRRILSSEYVEAVSELWDRSSLTFQSGCSGDCHQVTAQVCNGSGSEDMEGATNYEVYYAASGNPKNGTIVSGGQIPALSSGQCYSLTYVPTQNGNYMFKAYQRPGHPGSGDLWSNACNGIDMSECNGTECGNGILEEGEQCDDGNNIDGDGCSATCEVESEEPECGNGVVEEGEECDDGNNNNNDECKNNCTLNSYCGDGNLDAGEQCDDGNNNDGDGCSATCEVESEEPECGNGVVEEGEECDDGNNDNNDECKNNCTLNIRCGNGIVEEGEQCDDGNSNQNDGCNNQCEINQPICHATSSQTNPYNVLWVDLNGRDGSGVDHNGHLNDIIPITDLNSDGIIDEDDCTYSEPYCGDGSLDEGEQCDDGNNIDGDGCSAQCTLEPSCGDGNLDEGEQCDDGNNINGDGCSATCEVEGEEPYCGDGNLDDGEQCDDGNNINNDGCSAQCTIEPYCGDGNLDDGEQCDDGNKVDGDGCSAQCNVEPYCGDGDLDEGEQCDDGNNVDGDGCSAKCSIEPFCGDGRVDEGEECDDGNKNNNDFCSNNCKNIPQPYCGDGNLDDGEQCDDGNNQDGDGCSKTCKLEKKPTCGDGNLDEGEQCDDGNNADGDGCSAICENEVVTPYCGDGKVDAGEQCDDGNNVSGDGCDASCNTEAPTFIVPTEVVVPTPATPVVVPDVIGFGAAACGVIYNDENITFTGFLNGNYGTDTVLQYSLTKELSWRTIRNVTGLGTGAASFSFTLSGYPSGVYNMVVRAVLPDGSVVGSVNCPFSVNLGDLIFGANEFVLTSQQGPLVNSGLIEFRKDEPQRLWIEAKGVTSFVVNAYKEPDFEKVYKSFQLEYDATGFRKLWTGMLEFPETGLYKLVGVVNGPGGSYSREINSVLVTEGSDVMDEVTLTVFERKVNKVFEVWNGAAVGQANPYISENGRFSFILPEGEYYIRASRSGYATLTSRITKISDQSLVSANIDMQQWTIWNSIKSLFNRGANNFDLNITSIPEFSLLQVGDLMAEINGVDNNGERVQLLSSMGNNYKVLMAYGDWNKEAQEQLDIWVNTVQALKESNSNIGFAALGTMPPFNTMKVFNERGGYDGNTINFFKPDDIYHDNYFSISLPHFFVLDQENKLKGMIVGAYPAEELSEKLLEIINQ